MFQQNLGSEQQNQRNQGPCWALCTLLPSYLGRGNPVPPAQPQAGGKEGSKASPHPALTHHQLKQQLSPGEKMIQDGLSLPKRPRSLFNKMAFNCFKDFIKNSPWANYSQCFPATIYPASTCQLVTLPGPGSFRLCVPHPSVCPHLCLRPSVAQPLPASVPIPAALNVYLPSHAFLRFSSICLSLSSCHFPSTPSSSP